MATQFSDLQKLLINVAENKCDAFIKTHINAAWPTDDEITEENPRPSELPEFNIKAGIDDKYYNKVVFLKKYNAIYTKGTFFGYSGDLRDGLTNGLTEKGITVKYNPDAANGPRIETTVVAATYTKATGWDNASNVVTGETVKTYVDEQVAGAIAEATAAMNFKGEIIDAADFTRKLANANNGDVYVIKNPGFKVNDSEIFEPGDLIIFWKENNLAPTTYTVVEKNLDNAVEKHPEWNYKLESEKIAVVSGLNNIKPTKYTGGGDTFANTGNSYILATEAAVSTYVSNAIDALDHTGVTYTGTYISYAYHTTNGITYIDSIDPNLTKYTVNKNDSGETSLDNVGAGGLVDHEALNTVIGYLDGKIDAIDNAINYSVTTLTEVSDSDYLRVTENTADDDNDYNYVIALNVVSLSDAVGMTYDEATGKWIAPAGSSVTDGLASAADVANELVNDEKVIAAALNDHEARIDTLESFSNDINGTIQEQLVIGEVTVDGLFATKAKDGLVNADLLVSVINALDPWQEYE